MSDDDDDEPVTLECFVPGCTRSAAETHWRLGDCGALRSSVWSVCAAHSQHSRNLDAGLIFRTLYLPIVQPVMGSESAIAMEVAMLAATRLLRICNGGAEAAESLALLRAAQAAAWDGKEAA